MMKKCLLLFAVLFSLPIIGQVPNGGFENWANDSSGVNNPVYWNTSNDGTNGSVSPYQPAYAGTYSMLVKSWDPGFSPIPGMASIDFPFSSRPVKFKACYKANVASGDMILLFFSATAKDSPIVASADCTFKILVTESNYKCVDFPLQYISPLNPDMANITVLAGNFNSAKLGTEIMLDELSFGFNTSQGEVFYTLKEILRAAYPNPSNTYTSIPFDLRTEANVLLKVYDSEGSNISSSDLGNCSAGNHSAQIDVSNLPSGLYTYVLDINGVKYAKTFSVLH